MYKAVRMAGIAVALLVIASSTQVRAWGCVAVDSDGAYGYSYNWPDEEDAELTALKQCDAKSTAGDCKTDSCDPNG